MLTVAFFPFFKTCLPLALVAVVQVRRVLYKAAEAELASKPTSAADDERLLQVRRPPALTWGWHVTQLHAACALLGHATWTMPEWPADRPGLLELAPVSAQDTTHTNTANSPPPNVLRPLQTAHLMAPRQRAAAEFRLEKKRLLERAAAKARKRLDKAA